MKYQHIADVVVEFYCYATCVNGVLGGVEQHDNPSIFKKFLQNNRFAEKFQFATSKEQSSHIF